MKGYYTNYGYMGYIPSKGYILFCSKSEYEDYYISYIEEDDC